MELEGAFDVAMSAEESEIIAHLLGGQQFPNEPDQDPSIGMPPMFWPGHSSDLYYCSDFETNDNPYCVSQGSSSTSTSSFSVPLANNVGCCFSNSNAVPQISTCSTPMDFSIGEEQIIARSIPAVSYHQSSEPICTAEEKGGDEFRGSKEKLSVPVVPPHQTSRDIKKRFHAGDAEQPMTNGRCGTSVGCPKKKARASAPVPKKVKNAQSRKAKTDSTGNEEENNADLNVQSSIYYISEEDSNASQELNGEGGATSSSKGGTLSTSGRRKNGRRSATDPQSLCARVDISTMLEEAVQYVKFLQLQIKLLSSVELWMYAPIAYNGINIGLDLKISPPQQ
uniref:Uncharacterized protein LOC105057982 n=1 Tax=Elaeis guineensis var. tenera TaxID=51953 RepID=A0A8N4F6G5_ELAGV|nr:uncharacterized protein LOC105057982 [Elaeis guineensis]